MKEHQTMQRRTLLFAAVGMSAAASGTAAASLHWCHRPLFGLGTTLNLRAAHADAARAEQALDAAVAEIRAIEASMSLFRADSELQRLNRDGVLHRPSAHLLTVLREAQTIARRSAGAFDPTVQPLWASFERARQAGRLPSPQEHAAARSLVDWQAVEITDDRVRLRRPGMALTLNGIAQGHAADAAAAALRAHGIRHGLLDTGEFAMLGRNERDQPWTLGIEDPHDAHRIVAALRSDGRCIATSAAHRCAFSPDLQHHHIFDPATGESPTALRSVTVAATSGMRADALTKVMYVAGAKRIASLAQAWQVGVLWVHRNGRWDATPDLRLA
jgi:thiamine biosynthesis lipoprotein